MARVVHTPTVYLGKLTPAEDGVKASNIVAQSSKAGGGVRGLD